MHASRRPHSPAALSAPAPSTCPAASGHRATPVSPWLKQLLPPHTVPSLGCPPLCACRHHATWVPPTFTLGCIITRKEPLTPTAHTRLPARRPRSRWAQPQAGRLLTASGPTCPHVHTSNFVNSGADRMCILGHSPTQSKLLAYYIIIPILVMVKHHKTCHSITTISKRAQFSGIRYTHTAVQPSPPSLQDCPVTPK